MYNYTNGQEKWKKALTNFIRQTQIFYPEDKGGVMVEVCEAKTLCDADQESFKAYLARWLGNAIQMAPFTRDLIMPNLEKSAVGAAQTCEGPSVHGGGPHQCGMKWWNQGFDGISGVGPQMTALNVISVLGVDGAPIPYSMDTGGTSKGNPSLGSGDNNEASAPKPDEKPITTGDKAGAAILTIIVAVLTVGGAVWMLLGA